MKISTFVIATVVVAAIFAGFGKFMYDMKQEYPTTILTNDTRFVAYNNRVTELYNTSDSMFQQSFNDSLDRTGFDVVGQLIGTAVDSAKFSLDSFTFFGEMALDAGGMLQIDPMYYSAAMAIVIILLRD